MTRKYRMCEVCDQAKAVYWVELKTLDPETMPGVVLGSEAVCVGCLPIVASALVGAAEFAASNKGNEYPS